MEDKKQTKKIQLELNSLSMDEGTYVSLPVMIWPLMLPLRLMPNLGINLQQKTNGATAFQFLLDKSGHAPFRMDN